MSALDTLTSRPLDLADPVLPTLLLPDAGITVDQLDVQQTVTGQLAITPKNGLPPNFPYYGHAVATYQPVDLSIFGEEQIRLLVSGPCYTSDLADQIGTIFGVAFGASDVLRAYIPVITPGMTMVLRAAPTSGMWSGQLVVNLYLQTIPFPE